MNASENLFAAESPVEEGSEKPTAGLQSLRWWPAALLLVAMGTLKLVPSMLESAPLPVLMMGFMGPAVICLLIMVWWVFASRAGMKEKLLGLVAVSGLGFVTALLLDQSMRGMGTVLYQIPTGIGLFALTLILMAGKTRTRLPFALTFTAIGFGMWGLVLSKGVTGKFQAEFAWRWSPTPEEQYLKSLTDRGKASAADESAVLDGSKETVTRASSVWSDFRGPHRDGRLPGVILNEDWSGSPPKLVWKTRTGPGWSSFTVSGKRLFTQEQRGDNEAVVCLNAETGSILWAQEYSSRFWEAVAGAGPRATPTIADEGLFALGADGILLALNPMTGEILWKRDLKKDAGRKPPEWGFASSPLVYKGLVIVHAGGPAGKGVLAYDAKSGELRWSVASGDHSYSSPQLADILGTEGILMSTDDGLQFLSPDDGTTIWNHEWVVDNYRATQPLVTGNSIVFATSLGLGTRRLTVSQNADLWTVTEEWTTKEMKPDFNDFVEYQGYIYGFDGNIFACLDAVTGKRLWKKGRYGNGEVLLLPDAGQMLVITEQGDLVLVKADPARLDERGRIPAIQGKTWNHPVVAGDRVFVRNAEEAACFVLSTTSTPASAAGIELTSPPVFQ